MTVRPTTSTSTSSQSSSTQQERPRSALQRQLRSSGADQDGEGLLGSGRRGGARERLCFFLMSGLCMILLQRLHSTSNDMLYFESYREMIAMDGPSPPFSDLDITDSASSSSSSRGKRDGTSRSSVTKIVGFTNGKYKSIALGWYEDMLRLGYNNNNNNNFAESHRDHEVMLAVHDEEAVEFFESYNKNQSMIRQQQQQKQNQQKSKVVQYDTVYNSTMSYEHGSPHRMCHPRLIRDKQKYRRSMFGSRWTYVLRLLRQGYHVLITDIDNIFVKVVDFETEYHSSEYDIVHAYGGFLNSFPQDVYARTGLTVCGGMSWLRSTPGVVQLVEFLVDKCDCTDFTNTTSDPCTCYCDDQVVLNDYIEENYVWDNRMDTPSTPLVAQTREQVNWGALTGTDKLTGNRVKVWDRNTAFRSFVDMPENEPPCPKDMSKSWIAMPMADSNPTNRAKYTKPEINKLWKQTCLVDYKSSGISTE